MADPFDTPGYRYALNRYPGDGSTTQWDISFAGVVPGYVSTADVQATLVDDTTGVRTAYPLSPSNFILPTRLSVTPAVPVGVTLEIRRATPKDEPLLDYTDGALMIEKNLDTSNQQAIYVAAEMVDRFADALDETAEFSEAVLDRLADVETTANTASDAAAAAVTTANLANSKADTAVQVSADALAGVEGAEQAAIDATAAADAANAAAAVATSAAADAEQAALDALATAASAETIAQNAEDVANGIDAKAQSALDASAAAVATADAAEAVANAIDAKATQALDDSAAAVATANAAEATANGIEATALDALAEATAAAGAAATAQSAAEAAQTDADTALTETSQLSTDLGAVETTLANVFGSPSQSIVDVTASRAFDLTVYENTTGRPIIVYVGFNLSSSGIVEVQIRPPASGTWGPGNVAGWPSNIAGLVMHCVIPTGASYRFQKGASASINNVKEYR